MLARQYISEALAEEENLRVTDVTVTPQGAGARVEVTVEYQGERLALTLEV